MLIQGEYRPAIVAQITQHRREFAAQSPKAFAQTYLHSHFHKPLSRMHIELFALLKSASVARPKRLAIAAPRGHAKTTLVSLAYALWCAMYQKEMFMLLISATKDQATGLLKNIKYELQTNPRLLQDFPEVAYPPGARPAPKPWRDNQIVLRNGVAIKALGAGQGIRGTKHGRHRPSLIIVDDLEEQEQVASAEQREKLRDWFEKTLLKSGDPLTNVIFVGTILHYDSLLACHVMPPTTAGSRKVSGWGVHRYQAVEKWSGHPDLWEAWESVYNGQSNSSKDGASGPSAAMSYFACHKEKMLEGSKVLWPELEDYYALMVTRVREGRLSFQSEKQNDPLDPKECIFREESFRYWDRDYDSPADVVFKIGSHARISGACDPSLGQRGGQGDFTAIVVILEDSRNKQLYVLDADIARRSPDKTIDRIVELARIYKFKEFAVESNQFQQLLVSQLKDRLNQARVSLRIKEVKSTANKQTRIESLEPMVSQGILRFSIRQQQLLEQLRQFPLGSHDDGPDALHMAVEAARRPGSCFVVEGY